MPVRRTRPMRSRPGTGVLLAALIAIGCAGATAPFEIVTPAPPPDSTGETARAVDYRADLAAIAGAFEDALQLPRPDVALVLFPGRRSFEQGLLQIGYPPALARSASAFNAIAGARAILLNAEVVDRFERRRRVRLLAHELVHSVQYQFGGGTRGASEQWLREGFADWVACRIAAHLGFGSFESCRDDRLRDLAGVRFGLPPVPFDSLVTFPQWVEAQRRYEAPLYVQAFVAAELLVDTHGIPAIIDYFERFQDTTDYEGAFAGAFGLQRAEFERAFMRRWHEVVSVYRMRG